MAYLDGIGLKHFWNNKVAKELDKRAVKYSYNATIPTTGWSSTAPYTLEVSLSGMLATDTPEITVVQSTNMATAKAQLEAWNCISNIVASADKLVCTCYDTIPKTAIPVLVKGMRTVGEDNALLINYYTKSEAYSKNEVYNKEETYNKNEVFTKEEVLALLPKIERITQVEYDTLVSDGNIDENTLYFIVEESGE